MSTLVKSTPSAFLIPNNLFAHTNLLNDLWLNLHYNLFELCPFFKCGHGDSILVEGKGHFGLIDSANPTTGKKKFKDKNIFFVLKCLKKLKVQKLDFIFGTNSHSDHIGGIKEITYEYVDNSTIY